MKLTGMMMATVSLKELERWSKISNAGHKWPIYLRCMGYLYVC